MGPIVQSGPWNVPFIYPHEFMVFVTAVTMTFEGIAILCSTQSALLAHGASGDTREVSMTSPIPGELSMMSPILGGLSMMSPIIGEPSMTSPILGELSMTSPITRGTISLV